MCWTSTTRIVLVKEIFVFAQPQMQHVAECNLTSTKPVDKSQYGHEQQQQQARPVCFKAWKPSGSSVSSARAAELTKPSSASQATAEQQPPVVTGADGHAPQAPAAPKSVNTAICSLANVGTTSAQRHDAQAHGVSDVTAIGGNESTDDDGKQKVAQKFIPIFRKPKPKQQCGTVRAYGTDSTKSKIVPVFKAKTLSTKYKDTNQQRSCSGTEPGTAQMTKNQVPVQQTPAASQHHTRPLIFEVGSSSDRPSASPPRTGSNVKPLFLASRLKQTADQQVRASAATADQQLHMPAATAADTLLQPSNSSVKHQSVPVLVSPAVAATDDDVTPYMRPTAVKRMPDVRFFLLTFSSTFQKSFVIVNEQVHVAFVAILLTMLLQSAAAPAAAAAQKPKKPRTAPKVETNVDVKALAASDQVRQLLIVVVTSQKINIFYYILLLLSSLALISVVHYSWRN